MKKVAKAAKNIFSRLFDALVAAFAGFVANKAIRMIQAAMKGDIKTFVQMGAEMIKGMGILGGMFYIMSRGLMLIPDLIFGATKGIRNMFKALKNIKNIFSKGLKPPKKGPNVKKLPTGKTGKSFTKKIGKEGAEKIAKEGTEKIGKQIAKQGVKKAAKKELERH